MYTVYMLPRSRLLNSTFYIIICLHFILGGVLQNPKHTASYSLVNYLWSKSFLLKEPLASLRSVSPGALTDGVTVFFPQKSDDLFSHRLQKWWPFLVIITIPTLSAFQVIVSPVFFVNSAANGPDYPLWRLYHGRGPRRKEAPRRSAAKFLKRSSTF